MAEVSNAGQVGKGAGMRLVIIIGAALLAGVTTAVWSLNSGALDPIDPVAEERWLVRKLAGQSRLASFVRRRLDRTSAGGLLLTVGLVTVFVLAVLAGWVFNTLDDQSGFAQFDESVAEFGAANATAMSTSILHLVTDLGGTTVVVVVGLAVGVWGWLKHRNVHILYFMIAVIAGQSLVNNGLKLLVDRDRPSVLQLQGWAGSSFPSGHSAAAAALWAAVALVVGLSFGHRGRAYLAGAATLLATAVAATRTLLGVHWLSDVVAGLAVGWAWFTVCAVAFGGRIMQFGEPRDEVVVEARPSLGVNGRSE